MSQGCGCGYGCGCDCDCEGRPFQPLQLQPHVRTPQEQAPVGPHRHRQLLVLVHLLGPRHYPHRIPRGQRRADSGAHPPAPVHWLAHRHRPIGPRHTERHRRPHFDARGRAHSHPHALNKRFLGGTCELLRHLSSAPSSQQHTHHSALVGRVHIVMPCTWTHDLVTSRLIAILVFCACRLTRPVDATAQLLSEHRWCRIVLRSTHVTVAALALACCRCCRQHADRQGPCHCNVHSRLVMKLACHALS